MAVSLRSIAVNSKINFTTAMQVESRTRFNAFTYLGEVPFTVATIMSGDVRALVNQTKAYFRDGSSTDETKITYVLVKLSESAKPFAIPEPLIDLNSLELAGSEVFDIVVRDSTTAQILQQILSSNGMTDFSVVSRQV